MSMTGLYTPPDYTPPTEPPANFGGIERRSKHPVDVLSRTLNQLCLEASDQYEIIAHLEALGYNSPSKLNKLGESDHFSLGTKLFERTPVRFAPRERVKRREVDRITPLVMLLTLALTILMSAVDTGVTLIPAVIVLVWSQLGSSLLSRSKGELDATRQRQVLTILMLVGAACLAGAWGVMRFGLETASPPLVWYAVAGLLWSNRKHEALILPVLGLLAFGSVYWPGLPSDLVLVIVAVMAVALAASTVGRPTLYALRWMFSQGKPAAFFTMYGLGQGLLLIVLLADGPANPQVLAGTLLLAASIASSSGLLTALLNRMMRGLWSESDQNKYVGRARVAILVYVLVYTLPIMIGLAVRFTEGNQRWLYHWFAFALFGMILAIAVTFFTLGQAAVPALSFLGAGLAVVFTNLSFLMVGALLAAVLIVLLMWWTKRVDRYAIYLI